MASPVIILLVEDQPLIQKDVEEALTDGGFAVASASSGKEAMAMLDKNGTDYSALITDVNLSGKISGWDVAKHAREINEKLPVIYMTSASAHDWASKGVPNSQLVPKPFAIAQLITAVSHLINEAANPL